VCIGEVLVRVVTVVEVDRLAPRLVALSAGTYPDCALLGTVQVDLELCLDLRTGMLDRDPFDTLGPERVQDQHQPPPGEGHAITSMKSIRSTAVRGTSG
jgi:hypothetical protein